MHLSLQAHARCSMVSMHTEGGRLNNPMQATTKNNTTWLFGFGKWDVRWRFDVLVWGEACEGALCMLLYTPLLLSLSFSFSLSLSLY